MIKFCSLLWTMWLSFPFMLCFSVATMWLNKDRQNCGSKYTHVFNGLIIYEIAAAAKSLQSCPTLCNPVDGSPPGSPVPGILQARMLEWVAIPFSNAWKWKVKVKSLSCVRLLATPWTTAYQPPRPWDFPGKSTGVGAIAFSGTFLLVFMYCQLFFFHQLLAVASLRTRSQASLNTFPTLRCHLGLLMCVALTQDSPSEFYSGISTYPLDISCRMFHPTWCFHLDVS